MASQMADCQQDTVSVTVYAGDYRFKASGYTVTFDGFTALYEEATDEKEKKETALPPLEEGMVLKLRELKPEQKFTQPPARYTEATRRWRKTASAVRPPMRPSSPPSSTAIMWSGTRKSWRPPRWAA